MNYKKAYLYLNISSIILFSILFLAYLKLPKLIVIFDFLTQYNLFYRIPLVICFIINVVFFIIIGITNRSDPNNHFKKVYNSIIISIIVLLSVLSFFYEFIDSNSVFLKTMIKPFSDFFGFIVIEDSINKLLNNKLNDINQILNEHKVYNNWHLFVNNIKRRLTKNEITVENLKSKIDFDINSNDFIYFKNIENDNSRDTFIRLLNVKEDTGYIIWLIIIIILLYYIK